MTNLLLASLCSVSVFACATSDVDVATPTPTPRDAIGVACAPGTDVLLHIDRRGIVPEAPNSSFIVYTTGAWKHTATGKAARTGCVTGDQLRALDASLAKASWKYTDDGVRCEIYSVHYTDYHYRGKKVITLRACDGKILDPSTDDAITLATKTSIAALDSNIILALERRGSNPKRSNHSKLVVREDGSWSYTQSLEGQTRQHSTGSLAAPDLLALRQRLAAATWTAKLADATCAAWSDETKSYVVDGILVATRRICDAQMFDAATDEAFSHIDLLESKLSENWRYVAPRAS